MKSIKVILLAILFYAIFNPTVYAIKRKKVITQLD